MKQSRHKPKDRRPRPTSHELRRRFFLPGEPDRWTSYQPDGTISASLREFPSGERYIAVCDDDYTLFKIEFRSDGERRIAYQVLDSIPDRVTCAWLEANGFERIN